MHGCELFKGCWTAAADASSPQVWIVVRASVAGLAPSHGFTCLWREYHLEKAIAASAHRWAGCLHKAAAVCLAAFLSPDWIDRPCMTMRRLLISSLDVMCLPQGLPLCASTNMQLFIFPLLVLLQANYYHAALVICIFFPGGNNIMCVWIIRCTRNAWNLLWVNEVWTHINWWQLTSCRAWHPYWGPGLISGVVSPRRNH